MFFFLIIIISFYITSYAKPTMHSAPHPYIPSKHHKYLIFTKKEKTKAFLKRAVSSHFLLVSQMGGNAAFVGDYFQAQTGTHVILL